MKITVDIEKFNNASPFEQAVMLHNHVFWLQHAEIITQAEAVEMAVDIHTRLVNQVSTRNQNPGEEPPDRDGD